MFVHAGVARRSTCRSLELRDPRPARHEPGRQIRKLIRPPQHTGKCCLIRAPHEIIRHEWLQWCIGKTYLAGCAGTATEAAQLRCRARHCGHINALSPCGEQMLPTAAARRSAEVAERSVPPGISCLGVFASPVVTGGGFCLPRLNICRELFSAIFQRNLGLLSSRLRSVQCHHDAGQRRGSFPTAQREAAATWHGACCY